MLAHHLMRVKGRRWAEYVGYAESNNTADVTIPSTVNAGDIAVLIDKSYGGVTATPSAVIPSGWTEFIASFVANRLRHCFSWRVLTSGDIGSTVAGMPLTTSLGKGDCQKLMPIFRIRHGRGSPSLVNVASEMTNNDPAAQTVSASNYGKGSVTCAYKHSNGGLFTSGSFDSSQINTVNTAWLRGAYKLNNLTTDDNIIDIGDSGNDNVLASWLIIDQ